MRYTVSFDQNDKLVILQISSTASFEDCCTARDEALRLCNEQQCSRLLVDARLLKNNRPSPADCYYFGESLSYTKLLIYIAHVMPTDVTIHEDIQFISTVAKNRGVISKNFATIDEAKTWLLEEIGKPKKWMQETV
jgi:hypothetical protein